MEYLMKHLLSYRWTSRTRKSDFEMNFGSLGITRGYVEVWKIWVIAVKVHDVHNLAEAHLKDRQTVV